MRACGCVCAPQALRGTRGSSRDRQADSTTTSSLVATSGRCYCGAARKECHSNIMMHGVKQIVPENCATEANPTLARTFLAQT